MMKTFLFVLVLVVLVHRDRAVSSPDRCPDSESTEQETNVWSETTHSCKGRDQEPDVGLESEERKCKTFESTMDTWLLNTPYSGHIKFANESEEIPVLFTWARGYDTRAVQMVFDEYNFNATDLNFTMHRIDHKGWAMSIDICWAIAYPGVTEKTMSFGDEWNGERIDVPPVTWFSTPSILETSENSFTVLGREIHASQVHKLMQDVTKGKFPVTQTTSSEVPFELTIRGDIFYVDDDVTFQGLKKMEIYARKMVSNGNTLNLTAPEVCDSITADNQCVFDNFDKAWVGEDGIDGKSGIDSPVVGIYLHELLGNVNLVTRASNGTKGQDGGLGKNGTVKGEDGRKAGTSGDGGKASEVTIYVVNMTGRFTLNRLSGMGSPPAEHGYGGVKYGYPDHNNLALKPVCKENCKDDESMESAQLQKTEFPFSTFIGKDGFEIYPTPK
ncbi:uncharacterized protein LOC143450544 [Clavelina lepadiformis]|uniref:uncharacterized protein LOC143450544 n=1 Tax=Clavelina lepadiformis TaxID=159417 RepID=UPI00404379BE